MELIIDNIILQSFDNYKFNITIHDNVVGVIRILKHMDAAEIVYEVKEEWRNKGVATKAVKVIVKHIFENMDGKVVRADLFCDNVASKRVLEKAGFVKDETIGNKQIFHDGQLKDTMRYHIINDK